MLDFISSLLNFFTMVKQKGDEPDNKALERLRQFEEQRKPVPEQEPDNDKKNKNKGSGKEQQQPGNKRDKATDEL
jgi:hypothetical protein